MSRVSWRFDVELGKTSIGGSIADGKTKSSSSAVGANENFRLCWLSCRICSSSNGSGFVDVRLNSSMFEPEAAAPHYTPRDATGGRQTDVRPVYFDSLNSTCLAGFNFCDKVDVFSHHDRRTFQIVISTQGTVEPFCHETQLETLGQRYINASSCPGL